MSVHAPVPEPLAGRALALLAVDPFGLGGAVLRLRHGPERDEWLAAFRRTLPEDASWRRLPANVDDDRLLGGLDLSASLAAGKPLLATGLLVEADGGAVVLPMAERLPRGTAARLAAAMDQGAVLLERDGLARRTPTRFCLLALDEGCEEEERLSPDLADRLALHLDEGAFDDAGAPRPPPAAALASARQRLAEVHCSDEALRTLGAAAQALGVDSLRPTLFALRAARAAAALAGRDTVEEEDLLVAVQLVLAPRATRLPAPPPEDEAEPPEAPPEQEAEPPPEEASPPPGEALPRDLVLEAVRATLPEGLIASLVKAAGRRDLRARTARGGPPTRALRRGRPVGIMRGDPRRGYRLHLPATLKAAAPWQKLRRALEAQQADGGGDALRIRSEDFRVVRYRSRRQTTRIFVVDASGSAAAQRLAETKGAVELLLSESYATRDQVALIAFRAQGAELLLPPTRALARARRELAGLPGGGGTPLAAGLHAARDLAADLERKGQHPVLILMTDGRANVRLDGGTGHAEAREEALLVARHLRARGWDSLLVDTGRRPRPAAKDLAEALDARYLPLPRAGTAGVTRAAQELEGRP